MQKVPQCGAVQGDTGRASGLGQPRLGVLHDKHLQTLRESGGKAEKERGRSCRSPPARPSPHAVGPATGLGLSRHGGPSCPSRPHLPSPSPSRAPPSPCPIPGACIPSLCPASSIPKAGHGPPRCRAPPCSSLRRAGLGLAALNVCTITKIPWQN